MKKIIAILLAAAMLMATTFTLIPSAARKPNTVVDYGTPTSTETAPDAKWDAVTSKLQLVKGWAEDQPAPSVKVMYDETNLYFLFETSITSFLPGVNMVQFLLSDKTAANGQCADFTLDLNDMSFSGGLSAGVTAKRYNEADKTVVEITAPWASVASDLTVAEGAVIYLEIISQLNNAENYSFSMTADEIWGSYLHCNTGTTNFGTLTLGAIPVSRPSVEVAYGTSNSTDTAPDAKWDAVTSKLQLVKGWAEDQPAPSVKVMYDETNLYFLFETSITSFLPGVNMVQFLLSDKTAANGQCADFTLNLNDMSFTGDLSAGVTAKRYNEADKTVVEITAPWASVASDLTVAAGAVIYLEIISQLNNAECYSFSMTADEIWTDYLHCSTGTKNFGTLVLGEVVAPEADYVANITTSFSEVVVGNQLTVKIDASDKTFASGEITLTYDTALSFAGTNLSENVKVKDDKNGTVTITFYGKTKGEIEVYFVGATAKEDAQIALTYAAFGEAETAASENLTKADLGADAVTVNVIAKTFTVVLPEGLETADGATGSITVKDGDTLNFRVAPAYALVYKDIVVKLGEEELTAVEGIYSITVNDNVNNVTLSGAPKSFSVKLGDNDPVADAATYLTDYTWKLPYTAATDTVDGSKTKVTGVTIGGVTYTDYEVSGENEKATLIISGDDIKGDIVVTYETEVIPANKWNVSVNGTGAGAAGDYAATVEKNASYTLTIMAAPAGYKYVVTATMGGTGVTLDDSVTNKYTIAAVTGDVVFTVEKVVVSNVSLYEYAEGVNADKVFVRLNDTVNTDLFLVLNKVAKQDGIVYTYNDVDMFWSAKYEAYCVLVVAESSSAALGGVVGVKDGTTKEVAYDGDVNMASEDDVIDANDAQLVYNMYNATYAGFTADVTMEKFLRADVTGDGIINVGDATAIVNEIMK